jgi:hypothetical protein
VDHIVQQIGVGFPATASVETAPGHVPYVVGEMPVVKGAQT